MTKKSPKSKKKVSSKKEIKKSDAEKELEKKQLQWTLLGAAAGFALVYFILRPLFTSFGWETEWWIYLVVILISIGSVTKTMKQDMANEKIITRK